MIKYLAVGIWACLVTAGATFAAQKYSVSKSEKPKIASAVVLKAYKTKEINIPRIVGGRITGYVVAQFIYDVDSTKETPNSLSPDPFVVDEAYRYLYDDASIDFSNMKPLDLTKLTDAIRDNTNRRLGGKIVSAVTIQELSFLAADQTDKPI